MLLGVHIRIKYMANTCCVSSVLGDVDGHFQAVFELEFVGFYRVDFDDRHLVDQLLRVLFFDSLVLAVPRNTLQIESCDVTTELRLFLNLVEIEVICNSRKESGFVQSPLFLPASRLHKRRKVGFRDMQT